MSGKTKMIAELVKQDAELAALRARVVELERERDDVREALGMIGGGVGRSLGDEVRHQCAESTSRRARLAELGALVDAATLFVFELGDGVHVEVGVSWGQWYARRFGSQRILKCDTRDEAVARARELAGGKGGG